MYSIKIMSGEDLADSDVAKGFKMILVDAGDTFEFFHDDDGKPNVIVFTTKGEQTESRTYPVTGNAYVMSTTGKTVASFWARNKTCVKITLDDNDPEPERTIASIQRLLTETDRVFPLAEPERVVVHESTVAPGAALLERATELGLTPTQLNLVKGALLKRPVGKDAVKNDAVMRSEIAYLVSAGVPVQIALPATIHLNGLSRLDASYLRATQ